MHGTGFTILHFFTDGSDGGGPVGPLLLSGNTLYGTTTDAPSGNIFSISFLPQLTITPSASNVILMWPTNYAGFDYSDFRLQSTTNLTSSAWATVSAAAVAINGQYTLTSPISGTQQFFRLSQ